ncbi:hypothetical protein DXT99_02065 [Pontibacter diazotrophicus]|uniref:DUF5615 domain-containing protein n=2 Tax=Pontibacter diazotrophicus TaxID=1400979 RepID=A0A3D8LIZ6_9BACT|nr:hypothetical protein DXT99_02065 [Pontibacter diazotrophicus]
MKLVSFFQNKDVEAQHVNNILNSFHTSDKDIAAYADENKLIVITKDVDFRNAYFLKKSPQRLIRTCLGNIATTELISIFENNLTFLKKTYAATAEFYVENSRDNTLVTHS